jgi:hypothetical protein
MRWVFLRFAKAADPDKAPQTQPAVSVPRFRGGRDSGKWSSPVHALDGGGAGRPVGVIIWLWDPVLLSITRCRKLFEPLTFVVVMLGWRKLDLSIEGQMLCHEGMCHSDALDYSFRCSVIGCWRHTGWMDDGRRQGARGAPVPICATPE